MLGKQVHVCVSVCLCMYACVSVCVFTVYVGLKLGVSSLVALYFIY